MDSTYSHFLKLEAGGSVESEGDRFYIRLDESAFVTVGQTVIPYELSTDTEFGLKDCGISKDEVSSEDKYCILDINEMDLLGTEGENAVPLTLEYNVPKETCDYTSFYIPWHFNQPIGEGPPALIKCTVKAEQPEPSSEGSTPTAPAGEESTFYAIPSVSTLGSLRVACAATNPGNRPAGSWIKEPKNAENFVSRRFCGIFDLSDTDSGSNGLANCCMGKYILYSCNSRETEGEGTGDCDDGESNDWGGELRECIGGPLRVNNWNSNINREGLGEYPIPIIVPSWEQGLKEEFELTRHTIINSRGIRHTSNMVVHPKYSSIGTATYYDGIEDLQWTSGCSDCPNVFKTNPMSFLDNQSLLAYPYFTLECLDGNMEAVHRLHLIIREWNTLEEFYSFKESDGRSGDPDISGREGDECQYYEPDEFGDNDCNDLTDLDDVIANECPPFIQSILNTIFTNQDASSICAYPFVDYNEGGSQ